MRSDNSALPGFLDSLRQSMGRFFFSQLQCWEALKQNIAYSKDCDQDGEGIENQVLKEQLKELVMISLSKTRLREEGMITN